MYVTITHQARRNSVSGDKIKLPEYATLQYVLPLPAQLAEAALPSTSDEDSMTSL
jgi:hypothetical protein